MKETINTFNYILQNRKYLLVGMILLLIFIPGGVYAYLYYSSRPEKISVQEQMRRQAVADKDFADGMREREEVYPWADQLPLQKEYYFVYFDFDKKQFIAKIYPQKTSSISLDQQEHQYKKEIEKQLKTLSDDTARYKVAWVITPE